MTAPRGYAQATIAGGTVLLELERVDQSATATIAIRFAKVVLPDGRPGFAAAIISGSNIHHLDQARTQFVLDGLEQLAGVLATPGPAPGTEPS